MTLTTYRRGLSEPDRIKHLDAGDRHRRLVPGDAVTHVSLSGRGIIISASETEFIVLWGVTPIDPFSTTVLPLRRVHVQSIAPQLVSIQPMTVPSGLIFYLDHAHGASGSTG